MTTLWGVSLMVSYIYFETLPHLNAESWEAETFIQFYLAEVSLVYKKSGEGEKRKSGESE